MKRRNGRWHKEKSNYRLLKRMDELRKQSRVKEYVPLEEPIFAGWDIFVTVEGFRKDRLELETIINAIGWSSELFVRNVTNIRQIRKDGHSLWAYLKVRDSYYGYNSYINQKTYDKLSESAKAYFGLRYVEYYNGVRERYELKWNFPFYALKVNVKKSYYNYRIVYDNVAQSDFDKLSDRLYVEDEKRYGNRYRDCFIRANSSSWKNSLKEVVAKQLSPEEIIDEYTNLFKRTNNKRDYGWS